MAKLRELLDSPLEAGALRAAQQRLIADHVDVTGFVVEEIDTLMSELVATRRG